VFSFQRYRLTANPLHVLVSSHATCRSTVAAVCGVWIVAALFAVPSVLSKYTCETYKNIIGYYQLVVIFELLVSCVLPLCVVAFSYIMTARVLVESSRSISEGTQNPQMETRRNTAKTVVGLSFVFMISYVPYHVFWAYFIYSEYKRFEYKISDVFSRDLNFLPLYISSIHSHSFTDTRKIAEFLEGSNYQFQYTYLLSTCFLLINSCLNPVALFCTSSQFRQHLKRYLTCFCKPNSTPTDV
jgi:hypothetical protein